MTALHRTALLFAALTVAGVARADEPKAPPAAERFMMFVERQYGSWDNPLHTEVTLNGKSLGTFHSNTQREITEHVKLGVNTIVFTTTPQEPASRENSLTFDIGPVTTNPRTKKTVMKPAILRYRNGGDWKFDSDTGKYTHPFGPNPKTPDKKTVKHTYTFEYAGVAGDLAERKEGAFVLQSHPQFGSYNVSQLATISVNGKSLGTFAGVERSLDISKLLKPGENEIRLTTDAVVDQLTDCDMTFEIIGPLSYDVAKEKFIGKNMIQFKALEGWTRDKKTAQMHVKGSPGKTTHERVIKFTVE